MQFLPRTDNLLSPLYLSFTEPHLASESRPSPTPAFFSMIPSRNGLLLVPSCLDYSHSLTLSSWDPAVASEQGWGHFLSQIYTSCSGCVGEERKVKLGADLYSQSLCALHRFSRSGSLSANTVWDPSFISGARQDWMNEQKEVCLKLPQLSWNVLTRLYFVFYHLHQFLPIVSTFSKIKVDCQ